ncbi:hypothetical protein BH23DEI1_BH23DEI1_00300 [soil metagenome]|nr:hypothetical protein [Trueperaceae bacterium]
MIGRATPDLAGLMVNTDAALVDPDWDVFASEHDRRFGLAITQLKSQVRGRRYDNEVMRMRVGPRGFYVQSRRFPAAFYGDTVRPEIREIDADEVDVLAWEAVALYRSGEAQSLTCIYSDDDPPDVFFGYRTGSRRRYELGLVRQARPMHVRVMIEAEHEVEALGSTHGVLIVQRLDADRWVTLRSVGRRQPFAGLVDVLE